MVAVDTHPPVACIHTAGHGAWRIHTPSVAAASSNVHIDSWALGFLLIIFQKIDILVELTDHAFLFLCNNTACSQLKQRQSILIREERLPNRRISARREFQQRNTRNCKQRPHVSSIDLT
jgi:hypothetical protein